MNHIPKPRVFIVNSSFHDFSEARKYGELIFLSEGKVDGLRINKYGRDFVDKLKDITTDDYIVCTSLQILNFLLGFIIGWKKLNRVNVLYYQQGEYVHIKISADDFLKSIPETETL